MSSFINSSRINFDAIVGEAYRPLTFGFPAAIEGFD